MKRSCFIRQGVNEARLSAHEAARHAMKRSLFRLHVFSPKIWAKNGRAFSLNLEFSPQFKWLQVNRKWLLSCKLRKHLCFQRFLKQRKFFCSKERTFFRNKCKMPPKKDDKKATFAGKIKNGISGRT